MIAELVSFQNLLRRNVQSNPTSSSSDIYRTWLSNDAWVDGWSRGSVVFFTISLTVVVTWTIGEVAGYLDGPRDGSIWFSLGSVCVNVGLFAGIVVFLSSSALVDRNIKDSEGHTHKSAVFAKWYGRYFQQTMVRMLGSSGGRKAQGADQLWKGRLLFLQNEMVKVAAETTHECSTMVQTLSSSIEQNETNMRIELVSLERRLSELAAQQNDIKLLLERKL